MGKLLRIVVSLPAVLFMVLGIRWVVAPAGIAAEFGMPMLEGVALSTQIGDMGSFFFAGGLFVLIGVITQKRSWFYPPAMLLGFAALFRTLAWLLHDAAFAVDMIAVEVVLVALLLFAASRAPAES